MAVTSRVISVLIVFISAASVSAQDACTLLTDSITPCVCNHSILDCSAVQSEEELLSIPGLHTLEDPIGFDTITISENGFLKNLPKDAFGRNYAVRNYVFIDNNQLRTIDGGVFSELSGKFA